MNESLTLLAPRTLVLPHIVQEHALDAATLFVASCRLVTANDVHLNDLARHDQRIVAHLDGLSVAAEGAHTALLQLLAEAGSAEMFVLVAVALGRGDDQQLGLLLQRS